MRLKCECGWEGEIWDAAISAPRWDTGVVIGCPDCKRGTEITTRTETSIVYVIHDADGAKRYAGVPAEAE